MADTSKGAVYEKKKERRFYTPLSAVDPHDGLEWTILVDPKFMAAFRKEGMGKTKEFLECVRWVLMNPTQIYRGVREDDREIDEDNWLCYVGIPPCAYDWKRDRRVVPAWPDSIMLVCVDDDRVLYNWWWAATCPAAPTLPIDHETRFRESVFDA